MYKLLIVDDELTVRHGLRNYFNWAEYGIEVMGDAKDGDTALESIKGQVPDIVMTDVRMPNMDGIALSKNIRERHPDIKIIFISGHDDSDYLKSALQVSAVDYIFKPVNLAELKDVVERVVSELEKDQKESLRMQEVQRQLKESMPLLREKFLMSLIRDGVDRPERIHNRLEFLGLKLPVDTAYWAIVISVDDYTEVADERSERDRQLLSYSVLNICEELLERHLSGYVFEHRGGEFVGILLANPDRPDDDMEERLLAFAGDIRESLLRFLKISVTIGIGEQVSQLRGLALSYAKAREAADHKWYLGKNRIITMDSLEQEEQGFYRFTHSQSERLSFALKAAASEQVRNILGELFEGLSRNRHAGMRYGRNVCLQIVLLAGQLMMELGAHTPEIEKLEAELPDAFYKQETIAELRQMVEAYLSRVCSVIRDKRIGKVNNLVERVRAIIDRRYADNELTVAEIGKEVYLTDTYVSLLFKQETGKTVNEYLTQVRINKAKELLCDPRNKFYDICYAVGYADPSYFGKLFKKVTGFTLSAYRDNVI